MRQALFLCAAPEGFLLQAIPQRAVQPLGTPGQRPGYRGLADPQLLCDVRDPFALGEVHPQQLPLPGRLSTVTAPPCSAAIFCATARPKPLPCVLWLVSP